MPNYKSKFTENLDSTTACKHTSPSKSASKMCDSCWHKWETEHNQLGITDPRSLPRSVPQRAPGTLTEEPEPGPSNIKPCTDFTKMCEYCLERFEAGDAQGAAIHPCTDQATRCDYCWRAYEVSVSADYERVAEATDPCLSPVTMCDHCRAAFKLYSKHTPVEALLRKPGTYPVKFRRLLDKRSVGPDFVKEVGRALAQRLERRYKRRVRVHVSNYVPEKDGSFETGAWVLVDFPEVVRPDREMCKELFGGLPCGSRGWSVMLPSAKECVGEFRLHWFDSPRVEWNSVS